MFCNNCGKEMNDNAVFCQECGAKVNTSSPQQPPQQQQPVSHQQLDSPQPTAQQQPGFVPPQVPIKKKGCGCLVAIIAAVAVGVILLVLLFALSGGEQSESDYTYEVGTNYTSVDLDLDVREQYTKVLGDGNDVFTIMVYMIGSDLESNYGCATNDLVEMIDSQVGGNVNLIVQTGGAKEWQNDVISSNTVQRWQVTDEGLVQLEDVGDVSMVESTTVTDFVDYCEEEFPANRNGFIFWDHGGGTVWGFGSDEFYDGALMLKDIDTAFADADVKFDFVGYDACLMATIENAYMLEKHADYLIASEELEPGEGWDYASWLPALVENTSMSTIEIGKKIVDGFIAHNSQSDTLSIVELREIPYTYQKLLEFVDTAGNEMINNSDSFNVISNARSNAKSYYDGQSEMVDIVDLVSRVETKGANDVIAAIYSAVKYRNLCTLNGSNGLSMYFPYSEIDAYSNTRNDVLAVGFGDEYLNFFDYFVNVMAGGQMRFKGKSSIGNTQAETADFSQNEWYDPDILETYAEQYSNTEYVEKEIVKKGDGYVLTMTDNEWNNITDIQLLAMISDGEGYIDLGADNMWEINDNDLLIDFDNTWVALDGQIVPFYTEKSHSEDTSAENTVWYNYGSVPAVLNGEIDIDIIVKWDNESPQGYVAGYRYVEEETGPVGKGLRELKKGDKITFLCDFYDFDMNFSDVYELGEGITIGDIMPVVSYQDVGESDTLVSFRLTDIYQNIIYTETVEFSIQ